jgi:hypothetical protein
LFKKVFSTRHVFTLAQSPSSAYNEPSTSKRSHYERESRNMEFRIPKPEQKAPKNKVWKTLKGKFKKWQ